MIATWVPPEGVELRLLLMRPGAPGASARGRCCPGLSGIDYYPEAAVDRLLNAVARSAEAAFC